ncbi:MAG: hypothetical protein ACI4SS_05720 [Clostridia bacterium]
MASKISESRNIEIVFNEGEFSVELLCEAIYTVLNQSEPADGTAINTDAAA